jgi:predicted phosphodiesterase
MALYGVIADMHGNREALLAVLGQLDRRGVRRLICLGDIVGYNADSDACAELMRQRHAITVAGNHDLISIRRLGFGRCANKVIYSLKRTRRTLAPDTTAYLASLPAHHVLEGRILLTHAGVRDVEQYLTTSRHIAQNAVLLRADFPAVRVCFFGHVHVQKVYELDGDNVRDLPIAGPVSLRNDRVYFINPGSVDAARKSEDKLAEFALFDSDALSIEFQRIAYDDAAAEAKAAAGGYRIDPWTDRMYSLRRRLLRMAQKAGYSPRA